MTDRFGSDDVESLRCINLQLTEWERLGTGGRPKIEGVLDSQFCFRRGNGTVVDKQGYLRSLDDPGNSNDELSARVVQIQLWDMQALVEAHVYLDGTRGGQRVKGLFRNLRVWEKQPDDRWLCVFWYNRAIREPRPLAAAAQGRKSDGAENKA
jgi:hypothetical protein